MFQNDLFEIGTELLGGKPAEGGGDATAIRLGQLHGMIDQVNAMLAKNSAAGRVDPDRLVAARGDVPGRRKTVRFEAMQGQRQTRWVRPMGGMAEQEAAGAASSPPRPDPAPYPGVTSPEAQTIIHAAHVPTPRRRDDAEMKTDRVTAPEFANLLAKAGPDGRRDDHIPPAAFMRSDDRLPMKLDAPEASRTGIPANVLELPPVSFPWRAAGVESEAKTRAPLGHVPVADRLARTGAQIRRAYGVPSQRTRPAEMSRAAGRGVGAMIEHTWRRIPGPGGKTGAAAGDAAYSGAAGSGADSFAVIGTIVTATLAVAAEQLTAREPPLGRDPSLPGGVPAAGATPDRPLYTRIVTDQSPIPTMVTNHDALTSATVNMLAQHQGAMPTAPTGLNNNLVPPAPGVPAPGSYHP